MELSIQRLSSQQAPPAFPFSLPSVPVTSPSAPKSTLVTPPQQTVKPCSDLPGRDEPSALATSTPTHSQSSFSEAGMAIDTPPTSSDGEGRVINVPYNPKFLRIKYFSFAKFCSKTEKSFMV